LLRLLEPWVASAHYIATPAFNLGEPTISASRTSAAPC